MPPTTHSDSEDDDLDYVPPADDHDSETSSDEQDSIERATAPAPQTDSADRKKQRDALWASFQASTSTHGASTSSPSPTVNRVTIEKTYLFAGKHVTEVVGVTEDSEDARKWPRWSPRSQGTDGVEDGGPGHAPPLADSTPTPTTPAPASAPTTTPAPVSTPTVKRPGPRKSRTTLPSLPIASQPKKITTLDKCAMDWRAHVSAQSSGIRDELDANRRGAGYLDKVDFLKRVEDRREDALEASKATKRRRT